MEGTDNNSSSRRSSEDRTSTTNALGMAADLANNPAPIPTGRLFDDNGPKRHQHFYIERWLWLAVIITVEYIAWRPTITVTSEHRDRLSHVGRIEKPWAVFEALGSFGADNSDNQLNQIRNNIQLLVGGLGAYVLISRLCRLALGSLGQNVFRFTVGLIFVYYLNGASTIFVVGILLINYAVIQLHRFVNARILFTVIWISQVYLLILLDQYKTRNLFYMFFGDGYQWLNNHGGVMRWTVLFNMNTLRMLSFNWDYYEAYHFGEKARESSSSKHESSCVDCALQEAPCYKLRSDYAHPKDKYTLFNYLNYMFYAPLYLAGPMSSFNAFVSHCDKPQEWMGTRKMLKYAFEALRLYLSLEVFIHFVHFNAIRNEMERKSSILYPGLTIGMVLSLSMVALPFLWLKFSFIWKLFRCYALVDGIDVPEDMSRCFSNVCTIADFWQSWHASFNVWLVRYMYIPMGGSKRKFFSVWIIFGFIAIWHDVTLHLMTWAAVMCVTLVVEGVGIAVFNNRRMFSWMHDSPYFRFYRTIGAVGSCCALVLANYVGFGGGTQAGAQDDTKAAMELGPLGPLICTPLIFICGSGVGVILRQNAKHRHQTLKARFFGGKSED